MFTPTRRRGAVPVGIDFSATQLRLARERYPAVRFEPADAAALPFEAQTFGAVVNAFGMCHLPDPDLTLRDACRVPKAGGRVAFTVWDMPERAVGFGAGYAAIRAHGAMAVGLPAGPDFFFFSEPAQCLAALRIAGFDSPLVRQILQVWRLSNPGQLFAMVAVGTVRAAATLRAQSPAAREAIKAALQQAVRPYRTGDHHEIPMPAVLASATKP